jgi:hypothetical protein
LVQDWAAKRVTVHASAVQSARARYLYIYTSG